jgi:hypothetical protein
LGCASSDDDQTVNAENSSNEIPILNATGSLSEQTLEEAKETIYGKWKIANDSNPGIVKGSTAIASECELDYIEFTNDYFIIGFFINGESQTLFGTFELNEDANGFVYSVDLLISDGTENIKIAMITDIVVIESSSELVATFRLELFIPEEAEDFQVCNNIQGVYTAEKEDPMDESDDNIVDSNHSLFVNTWVLESAIESGIDISVDILMEPCEYYDEDTYEETYFDDCTPATNLFLSVSTYGTYTFAWIGSSEGIDVYTNTWSWTDSSQTAFYVGDIEDQNLVVLESLTDTKAVFSEEYDNKTTFYTFVTP